MKQLTAAEVMEAINKQPVGKEWDKVMEQIKESMRNEGQIPEEPAWVETAKRLVEYSWWEWKEGMGWRGPETPLDAPLERIDLAEETHPEMVSCGFPDLTDWATIGILIGWISDLTCAQTKYACGYQVPFPGERIPYPGVDVAERLIWLQETEW